MSDIALRTEIEGLSASAALDVSDLHAVLADERRRATLTDLADRSAPVDVEALARSVAARESDRSPESVPSELVERVHVTLHHVHLPKLADLGLVEYDATANAVTDVADGIGSLSS